MFVICPICSTGVAEVVPWSFADTRATVVACDGCRAAGVAAIEVKVSAVAAMETVEAGPVRHRDGMVVFA